MNSYYISPIDAMSIMFQDKELFSKTQNGMVLRGTCDVQGKTGLSYKIVYDKNLEESNNPIRDSFKSDGTLWFEMESMMKVFQTAIGLSATSSKSVTIGQMKISHEDCEGTDGKPWMRLRTIVEMPYIINNEDNK